MIVLDTHIWVWWVHGDSRLTRRQAEYLRAHETRGLGVCAISCWEIAMLVQKERLDLGRPTREWFDTALAYPGIRILELSPQVAVESTELPGSLHGDPADRLIIATARVWQAPLVTSDEKILVYPHVRLPEDLR